MLGLNLNRTVSDLRAVEFSPFGKYSSKKIIVSSGEMSITLIREIYIYMMMNIIYDDITKKLFQSFSRSGAHKQKVLQTVASLSRFIPFKKNLLRHIASASSSLTESSASLKIRHVPMEGDA
jgi:hypothetical protein